MAKVIIMGMVCCLVCACINTHTDEWPMFQHDPQHTGYSTSKMPESLQVLWEFEGPDSFWTYLIIQEGKAIAACGPDSVFSLDMANGSLLWETHESVEGFPAADEKRVYTGLFGEIICIDASKAEILWRHREENVYFEAPIVVDNSFITDCSVPTFISGPSVPPDVHEKNKKVFCLNAETGDVVWEFYCKEYAIPPVYYDHVVYIHDGASIYYVDIETGDLIWERETKIEGASFLCLSLDEKNIFVVSFSGVVSCLGRESGNILWQFDCKSVISHAPATGYDKVFFRSRKMVYCVDAKKGTLLWKREVGFGLCPPVVADKKVAVGAENILYILSARSGKIIESYTVRDKITSIALSDGKLVVGCEHGKIFCLVSSQNGSYVPVSVCSIIFILVFVIFSKKKRRCSYINFKKWLN